MVEDEDVGGVVGGHQGAFGGAVDRGVLLGEVHG